MGKAKKPTYQELEKYIQELENKVYRTLRTELINKALFDIANALNNTGSLNELYRSIHRILSKLMDMTNFYIAIYYKNRNAIRFVYHVDLHDSTMEHVEWIENFTQDPSLTGDVIIAGHPLLLKEDELKKRAKQGRVKGKVPRIWLGVPLKINREVMGVMAVQSYTDPAQFSQTDVDVLTFVSDQIALSIEKKRAQGKLEQTREKLIRTEKLEAIGTLAGGIAHDFNNTLSVTLGNINLAQMMVSDPEILQILDDAETSVMQAKELASRFIVFSKGGVLLKEKIKSKTFITQVIEAVSEENNIPYSLTIGQIPGELEVSVHQIKEAVRNIMVNAWEAMDQKGRVNVSFRLHPEESDQVVITISDDGKGIQKDQVGRIFEPYFSTKPLGKNKGTGLGMSIAYSIIKSHQGEILIESEPGQGTNVKIMLPVSSRSHEKNLPHTPTQQKKSDTDGNGEHKTADAEKPARILVMDDDPMVRDMSSKILGHLGYAPILAANGEEAVSIYKTAMNSKEPIHIVILDLEVRQGMGGVKTIRELIRIDPEVKAVIASGYSDDRVMEDYQAFGFLEAIAKPYSMKTLEKVLEDLSKKAIA